MIFKDKFELCVVSAFSLINLVMHYFLSFSPVVDNVGLLAIFRGPHASPVVSNLWAGAQLLDLDFGTKIEKYMTESK